ncbi:hypothetical protein [Metabacillus bambusae]|uniref:Bacitracin ABC transporter ATP-binding protein n=1 Tax=Metabacillus bambusae TaxID=2795218 RepID=A0ABS3MXL7_9BACI|nr:hypothetical protein [Metabacillus bambusae]MBO1510749.1 bacitracin ABC transporter ATP-binding protein [Metabacillus bambusae]
MTKEAEPILSDEFLDEVAREINQLYGSPIEKQEDDRDNKVTT